MLAIVTGIRSLLLWCRLVLGWICAVIGITFFISGMGFLAAAGLLLEGTDE